MADENTRDADQNSASTAVSTVGIAVSTIINSAADTDFDPYLGIRGRRSRSAYNNTTHIKVQQRNPIVGHTLETDLPEIRILAAHYLNLSESDRKLISGIVYDDKSLDYYYGSYVSYYQTFTLAHLSQSNMSNMMGMVLCDICRNICKKIDTT